MNKFSKMLFAVVFINYAAQAQEIKNFDENGEQITRFDQLGNAVDAHDGKIAYYNDTYYLYGTSYDCGFEWQNELARFCGFKSYSSKDMVNWKDEGFLFDAQTPLWQSRCDGKTYGCFRPHVVYNKKNKNYVLWINVYDNVSGYRVFTAKKPTGPFVEVAQPKTAVNSDKPAAGLNNGDHDLFVDDDGTCYLAITDWRTTGTIAIEQLTDDYLSGTGKVKTLITSGRTEAPGLFKRKGIYYVTYSDPNCGYCAGTGTSYKTAKSPLGEWSEGTKISDNSCGGQPSFVSTLKIDLDTYYLYGSDLWNNAAKNEALANFYWAPLTFAEDGSINPMDCIKSFTLNKKRKSKKVDDKIPKNEDYKASCDIGGEIQRSQSFTASSSGTLKSFSITTLKSGYPTADLTLTFYESPDGITKKGSPLASIDIPQKTLGWSARNITTNPNFNLIAGKKYILVLKSDTKKGCYGFAYIDSESNSNEISSISKNQGENFITEKNRKLKYSLVIE
ncbi:MAG: family 43 glycosylhydrolase [Chitinophagaceae bacterium]